MESLPRWKDMRQRMSELPHQAKQSYQDFNCVNCLKQVRTSKRMLVLVVFVAIYIDNMLTTTVVPIVPTYLFEREHPDDYKRINGQDKSPGFKDACQEAEQSWNITPVPNCTQERIPPDIMRRLAEEKLNNQSTRIGLLFASKSAVQLIANPFIGMLTNMIGYTIPMFTGFTIIFVSTLVFAFGKNFWVLLIARAVQGIGSSCSSVSGMGLIAEKYQDDRERGNAMGVALSGLALGVLIGPPFGGVLYQFLGKPAPFLTLAALALLDGALQLYVMSPTSTPEQQQGASLLQLLKDPYILVTSGAITFANMGIGMLEPTLPTFMLKTMGSEKWEQGIAFLPASVSYLIGTVIFGPMAQIIGRWLAAMIGMIIISVALFTIPFSTVEWHLVAPNLFLGFAIGMVDASMMPTMGYLVDLRHISVYGNVYAIADIAFCLGFALGPAVGGVIVSAIGFRWMLWIIAIVNLLYAPLLYFLRNPPGNKEKVQLVMSDKCPIKYVTYRQSTRDDDDAEAQTPGVVESVSEMEINEYNGDGEVNTRLAHVTRRVITNQLSDSSCNSMLANEDGESNSESDDTDGPDSQELSSSEDE